MRNYLKDINIVGAVMCYQEINQCRWSLDWLCDNCNKVVILLDNFNKETEDIINEYRDRFNNIVEVIYSNDPVRVNKNNIQGQIKKRFKIRQAHIRQQVIDKIKELNKENKIDLIIWPDSDETFIDEFPKYLVEFWNNRKEMYMMLGFIEPFDNFNTIMSQNMAPHGRVFKYIDEINCFPWKGRTRYYPYFNMRAWKVRNVVLHMCHFTEEYRKKREFFDNKNFIYECRRVIWKLPKDVRKMTVEEISDYQYGAHHAPPKYNPIDLDTYLKNNL